MSEGFARRSPPRPDNELVQLVVRDGNEQTPEPAEATSLLERDDVLQAGQAVLRHLNPTWRQRLSRHKGIVTCGVVTLVLVVVIGAVLGVRHSRKQTTLFLAPPPPAGASYTDMDAELVQGLGPVWWPPSRNTTDAANSHFLLGLRLLHVFWYDLATKEFNETVQSDPGWWAGYWGIAMASKQQLWMTEKPDRAHQALRDMQQKARLSEVSPRDQQYIAAAQALWAEGQSMEQRERAYSQAMEKLYTAYPDDADACAFYSLSLLCMTSNSAEYLSKEEEQQVLARARSVLDTCGKRWWDHAGLLHYITHAHDYPDPGIVAGGLDAGIHLSEVAPAACHAQHMKSHLFLQLGNWTQVVDSNYRAVGASDSYCNRWENQDGYSLRACDKDDRYHALEWWMYGLTQQCAFRDSTALLGRMVEIYRFTNSYPFNQWALRMWSHVVIQSQGAPALPPLMAQVQRGSPLLDTVTIINQVVAAANETLPKELYWEIHARASALVAAGYAVTLYSDSSSGSVMALSVADVKSLFINIQSVMGFLSSKIPQDMQSLRDMVTLMEQQLSTLQAVSGCLSGADTSLCDSWLTRMDQARAQEDKIWGKGPSLEIAPAMEMEGHLLLMTLNKQTNKTQTLSRAQQRFSDCLQRLPHRQSCLLGQARAAAATGDAGSASQRYLELWQQCAPVTAPPDFLWPGLAEAYWLLVPPANRTQSAAATSLPTTANGQDLSLDLSMGTSAQQHQYSYTYGSATVAVPLQEQVLANSKEVYQAMLSARTPPFPPPCDLDTLNRQHLRGTAYTYPYQGLVLPSPVPGYPAGRILYSVAQDMYSFLELYSNSSLTQSYWPPSDVLYSVLLTKSQTR